MRLRALKELRVDLPEYDEFMVRFMSAMETGEEFGSLRTLEFFKTPFKGNPSRISLGAFSLFVMWFKNEYHGHAKNLTVLGLPLQNRVPKRMEYRREITFHEPPPLLRSATNLLFHTL